MPIIYFMYYNPEYMNNLDGIKAYLIRPVLFTYFQSGTTSKLQQMKSNINDNDYEITVDMLEQMSDLRVTDGRIDDIINSEKGSRVAGEALYFLDLTGSTEISNTSKIICIHTIDLIVQSLSRFLWMTGEDGGATGIVCRIFSCSKAEVTAVKMLCGLQIIITT